MMSTNNGFTILKDVRFWIIIVSLIALIGLLTNGYLHHF